MFKNGYLRLLMTLIGFQQISAEDEPDASWIVPSGLSADQLKQSLELIKQNEFNPPVFDDGKEAEDLIRRKSASTAARRREAFDDESDNGIDSGEEEFLFPAGGPTAMKKSDALEALKTRRRRRKSKVDEEADPSITEEERRAREEARRAKDLEKQRKIKSALYIHDSDEESDEERDRAFFEQEEKLRQRTKIAAMKELLGIGKSNDTAKTSGNTRATSTSKKRRANDISSDSSDDDDSPLARDRSSSMARDEEADSEAEAEAEATDTPLSSPHIRSSQTKRLRISSPRGSSRFVSVDIPVVDLNADVDKYVGMVDVPSMDQSDDEEDVPVARTARRRVAGGFIVDSSDEE